MSLFVGAAHATEAERGAIEAPVETGSPEALLTPAWQTPGYVMDVVIAKAPRITIDAVEIAVAPDVTATVEAVPVPTAH